MHWRRTRGVQLGAVDTAGILAGALHTVDHIEHGGEVSPPAPPYAARVHYGVGPHVVLKGVHVGGEGAAVLLHHLRGGKENVWVCVCV